MEPSTRNSYRQRLISLDEARIDPLRRADHLDAVEALQHLFPDDLELELGKTHADAAVDTETEGEMRPRPRPIDDELLGAVDHFFVAVAGDVPHNDAIARLDGLPADLGVLQRGAPHMRERRLPADHL